MNKTRENRNLFKFVPLLFVLGGLILFGRGAIQLHNINAEIGNKTVEELTEDITALSEELQKNESEKQTEYDNNGFSDKYLELNERSSELRIRITNATGSRYTKETGKGNPDSLGDIMVLIPILPISVVVILAGIILQVIVNKK